MYIIAVGLNHRTAPVELRERFAVSESRLPEALACLKRWPGIDEGVILSTCNRVELYAVVKETAHGVESLRDYMVTLASGVSLEQLAPHLYCLEGAEAIRHLFRVAASLDAMVVGEPQILGQVKDAYDVALTHKATGVVLNKVMKKAISVGKRVRTETDIAENAVSVSYAAVELAKKIFQNLSEKTVLLVGVGEMGKLAARHFIGAGVRRVMIANRNYERAIDMAKRFNALPVPFSQVHHEMSGADIVLCATAADTYVIGPDDVHRALRSRKNRPMFLIDISDPRNIDPAVGSLDNAYLYNIDDLQSQVVTNLEQRRLEALKAEDIVRVEVPSVVVWLKSLEVVPTIVALRRKADSILREEIDRILAKLGPLSPRQRELVQELATAITNKFLHSPLIALKAEADSLNGALFAETTQRLFDLEKELESIAKAQSSKQERG
jgi:glutamyl-tRNA reductase